jgi:hypothetical protein
MSTLIHEYIADKLTNAPLDKLVTHSYPDARVTLRLESTAEQEGTTPDTYTVTDSDVRAAASSTPPLAILDYVVLKLATTVASLSKNLANQVLFKSGLKVGSRITLPSQVNSSKYIDFTGRYVTQCSVNTSIGSQSSFNLSLVGWHNVTLLSPIIIYMRGRPYDTLVNRNIRLGETDQFKTEYAQQRSALENKQKQALVELNSRKSYIVSVDGEAEFQRQLDLTTKYYDDLIKQFDTQTPTNAEQASTGNYVRVFWGVVTSVSKNYSGGSETTSISGTDITYWWARTTTSVAPLNFTPGVKTSATLGEQGRYTGLTTQQILTDLLVKIMQKDERNNVFAAINVSLWNPVTGTTTSVERLPNVNSDIVEEWFNRVDGAFTNFQLEVGAEVATFTPFLASTQIPTTWIAQFKDIWSMVLDVAGACNAEVFFDMVGTTDDIQDASGNTKKILGKLIFRKPLFAQLEYLQELVNVNSTRLQKVESVTVNNSSKETLGSFALRNATFVDSVRSLNNINYAANHVLTEKTLKVIKGNNLTLNEVYEISDIDIIDFTETLNAAGCVSSVTTTGTAPIKEVNFPQEALTEFATDQSLLRRFGYHNAQVSVLGIMDTRTLQQYAIDWLRINNAENLHTANASIIGRPLLKLGTFVKIMNQYWYITSINHSYTPKGQFQTQLVLIAGYREPVEKGKGQKFTDANNKEVTSQTVELVLDRFSNLEMSESSRVTDQGTVEKLGSVVGFDSQNNPIVSYPPKQEKTVVIS